MEGVLVEPMVLVFAGGAPLINGASTLYATTEALALGARAKPSMTMTTRSAYLLPRRGCALPFPTCLGLQRLRVRRLGVQHASQGLQVHPREVGLEHLPASKTLGPSVARKLRQQPGRPHDRRRNSSRLVEHIGAFCPHAMAWQWWGACERDV